MFGLVPPWAYKYEEFWGTIKQRNIWFIKLRYTAFFLLLFFYAFGHYILSFKFTYDQEIAIITIAFSILIYNIILHYFRKYVKCEPKKFNCLHYSLLQMLLDLIALMVLVYYTGGLNSPLYIFFVFHMIIGSLILPGHIVYLIASLTFGAFSIISLLQHFDIIPHHSISGIIYAPHDHSIVSDIFSLLVFAMMIYISVFLANYISRQLYRRERQLITALGKIEENEKSKQKYIMGIVHEIKSPITAVRSILDLVLDKFLGPIDNKINDKLNRARIRTDEAIHMINNILRLSKLKLLNELSFEIINVNSIIEKSIDKYQNTAKTKNINIFHKENDNNISVSGDHVLLELAISNLISNSIKYGLKDGKIQILTLHKNSDIIIEVSDDGIGIPKNEQQNIFSQFYRASNLALQEIKEEGSGMGLSVVKEIIEKHNGHIYVRSPSNLHNKVGPGTTFKIVISKTHEIEMNNIAC